MDSQEQQRLFEWIMYTAEQAGTVVWQAIRRDVIAAVALGGALADADLKVEISGPSLLNADSYALVAVSAADALIAKLDEPSGSEETPEGADNG